MERTFPFELKALSERGVFEGLASTYSTVDEGGDLVVPGAFTRTLREKGDTRPILWSHDVRNPLGLGTLTDTPAGLVIRGELDLDTQSGREAYSRLKKKIVSGLSIGYRTVLDKMEKGIRRLLDLELYEVSLCCFPMNTEAVVTAVKAAEIATVREFEHFLRSAGFSKGRAVAIASKGWAAGITVPEQEPAEAALLGWLQQQISRPAA
jgi:HK97 family phage prohead protease